MHSSNTEPSVSYKLPLPPPATSLPPPPPPPPPRSQRTKLKKGINIMSSNCTITRLVRWRVKDVASCFFACRFPLEEETEGSSNATPQRPKRSMVFDSKGSKTAQTRRKMAIAKKVCYEDGESFQSSSRNKSNSAVQEAKDGSDTADSSWPHFAEEDYIVFCFREDGEIHMINEGKPPSEPFDEIDEDENNHSLQRLIHREREVEEEESNESDGECPPDDIKEINPVEVTCSTEDSSAHKMDSFESCDSNLSDTSASSFAFPVLGIEWIGSPVMMPKSDKNKARSMHLHCCTSF